MNTQQPLSKETTSIIVSYGTYYHPATNHYNNGQMVVCDRCFRQNLNACIGYNTYDLCLNCADTVIILEKQNEASKSSLPSPAYNPETSVLARMMPAQFNTETSQEGNVITPFIGGNAVAPSIGGNAVAPFIGGNVVAPFIGGNAVAPSIGGNVVASSIGCNAVTSFPNNELPINPHSYYQPDFLRNPYSNNPFYLGPCRASNSERPSNNTTITFSSGLQPRIPLNYPQVRYNYPDDVQMAQSSYKSPYFASDVVTPPSEFNANNTASFQPNQPSRLQKNYNPPYNP